MMQKLFNLFTSELRKNDRRKFFLNILVFTAPALAILFYQLSQGVDFKIAFGVAVLAFWGLLADLFKKMNKS